MAQGVSPDGAITLFGVPFQALCPWRTPVALPLSPQLTGQWLPEPSTIVSQVGFIRVRSPLLTESQLFSFPALIDMLKFGASCRTAEVVC